MVRVATTIVNCYIPVVLNFHDFITKFTPFSFYGGGGLFDFVYQNNYQGKNNQIIP
jgi:hypothetical protein